MFSNKYSNFEAAQEGKANFQKKIADSAQVKANQLSPTTHNQAKLCEQGQQTHSPQTLLAYKEKTDLNKITHIIRHIRNNHPIELKYDKGTIVIDGNINAPYSVYDPRIDKNRALARHYQDITCFLEKNNQDYTDNVKDYIDCPIQGKTNDTNALRDYQKDALESWLSQNKKGCIILPTGLERQLLR